MPDTPPLIGLAPAGQPAIISYNVPEPTSYPGEHLISLEFPEDIYTEAAFVRPAHSHDNLDEPAPTPAPAGPAVTPAPGTPATPRVPRGAVRPRTR